MKLQPLQASQASLLAREHANCASKATLALSLPIFFSTAAESTVNLIASAAPLVRR